MNMTKRYICRVFQGEGKACTIAVVLITNSQAFTLVPLPYDKWEFTVKAEAAGFLPVEE